MPRTWCITGCSRGLGNALAKAVLASGNRVAATARAQDALADLLPLGGNRVMTLPLDVATDPRFRSAGSTVKQQVPPET